MAREGGRLAGQAGDSATESVVRDLAGMDVMTMPPKVAQDFLDLDLSPRDVTNRLGEQYIVRLDPSVDGRALYLRLGFQEYGRWDRYVASTELVSGLLSRLAPGRQRRIPA